MRRLLPRVAEKIAIDDVGGCWIWTAYKAKNGYGRTSVNGLTIAAHRHVYTVLVGEIQPGLVMDHLCRVRECVNPGHLEPVTQRINILRGELCPWTHCKNGHPLVGVNLGQRRQGGQFCVTCKRAKDLARYYANREKKLAYQRTYDTEKRRRRRLLRGEGLRA